MGKHALAPFKLCNNNILRLAEVERQLEAEKSKTTSTTRLMLEEKMKELERMKASKTPSSTTSVTRQR